MKKNVALLLYFLLILTGCGESFSEKYPANKPIKVAVASSPLLQVNPPRGLEARLLIELEKRMQRNFIITAVPFTELLPRMRRGDFDLGFASLVPIPERSEGLYFSDPYLERRIILLGKAGPMQVAARTFSKSQVAASQMPGFRLRETRNSRESLQLLKKGVVSRAWIEAELWRPGPWKVIDVKPIGESYAIATSSPLLQKEINRSLQSLQEEGTLQQITKQYLPG